MMSVIFRSLSSSRWARTPALKKILLWPIRNRLPSSSRALIYQRQRDVEKYFLSALKTRWFIVLCSVLLPNHKYIDFFRQLPYNYDNEKITINEDFHYFHLFYPETQVLTILSQACFPSIKPLGMALGVRISYLDKEHRGHRVTWTKFSVEDSILAKTINIRGEKGSLLKDTSWLQRSNFTKRKDYQRVGRNQIHHCMQKRPARLLRAILHIMSLKAKTH